MIKIEDLINSSIVLDACFLIDSFSHPREFGLFLEQMRKSNNTLLGINFVKVEFVRTKSKADFAKKMRWYEKSLKLIFQWILMWKSYCLI